MTTKPHPVDRAIRFTIKLNAVLASICGLTSALAIPAILAILFVIAPFVSDRQEDQIKVMMLPFARILGSSLVWGIGSGLLAVAHFALDSDDKVAAVEAEAEGHSEMTLTTPQSCYYCQFYTPSAIGFLEHPCGVHPSKPEAGWFCPDYELKKYNS